MPEISSKFKLNEHVRLLKSGPNHYLSLKVGTGTVYHLKKEPDSSRKIVPLKNLRCSPRGWGDALAGRQPQDRAPAPPAQLAHHLNARHLTRTNTTNMFRKQQ